MHQLSLLIEMLNLSVIISFNQKDISEREMETGIEIEIEIGSSSIVAYESTKCRHKGESYLEENI